ncbi:hypothetical protein BpHYR1_028034 [Brachionus plicatilis]|uniref:Uncharacterized protein n=1 Tax=Brachionus plicatilis TaxID=10195 RepID=A0A3M7QZQ3_BRAPC|nr:hypothetical protein BpHYR1_028034 [Brachionus plicatilis]
MPPAGPSLVSELLFKVWLCHTTELKSFVILKNSIRSPLSRLTFKVNQTVHFLLNRPGHNLKKMIHAFAFLI